MRKKLAFFLIFLLVFLGYGIRAQADITVVGSDSNLELMSNLVIAFGAKTGIPVDLRGPGSLEGLCQLINGKADLAFISRSLSGKQLKADVVFSSRSLSGKEDKALDFIWIPYCRDSVAVVVHPANQVENLTREELKEIFTGNRTTWDNGTGVVVLIRDTFSGTRQLFEEKIMDGKALTHPGVRVEKKGDGMIFSPIFSTFHPPFFPLIKRERELLFSLAKIRGAIAYLSIGHIPKESRVVKIDGVEPTRENIKTGRYLLSRTPMLVTRGWPKGEVKQIVEFIMGKEGQEIIERMGYISINR